jgi:hypothetical protein
MRNWLKRQPRINSAWSQWSALKLEKRYLKIREYYRRRAVELKILYDEVDLRVKLRTKLGNRLIPGVPYEKLHVYFIDDCLYEYNNRQLLPALNLTGQLTISTLKSVFDGDVPTSPWSDTAKDKWNTGVLKHIKEVHQKHPIHVVFSYPITDLLRSETILAIRDLGIPTVSYWCDDLQSFLEYHGGHSPHDVPLIPAFDLHWTTTLESTTWYQVEGGLAIYMPEGAEPTLCRPLKHIPRDIEVSFFGAKYGRRDQEIRHLKQCGIDVRPYGRGWGNGELAWGEISHLFARTHINLGIGGIGHSLKITCLKGRDFEVPMARGLYLTAFNPELARFYKIGDEILCYRHIDEAVELARYYLDHPEKADLVREAAYQRALSEHRWELRFRKLFNLLGAADKSSESCFQD